MQIVIWNSRISRLQAELGYLQPLVENNKWSGAHASICGYQTSTSTQTIDFTVFFLHKCKRIVSCDCTSVFYIDNNL